MRIILLTNFYLSGQSMHVLDLAAQLTELGHHVHLLIHRNFAMSHFDYYAQLLTKRNIPYSVGYTSARVRRLLATNRPDLIHIHSSNLFAYGRRLANSFRIPYGVTCHGLGLHKKKYYPSLKQASFIIAVGNNTARRLLPLYGPKVTVIPNGIDLSQYKPGRKGNPRHIFYIARLDHSKLPMLQALAKCVSSIPRTRLTVVANQKPPVKHIRFVPWMPNLHTLLAEVNIVAACGRTAREALACQCAVLLMNQEYDGIISPQLVSHSDFNFSGNLGLSSETELRGDLQKLLRNGKYREGIQRFAASYANKHLGVDEMVRQTVAVYEKATSRQPDKHHLELVKRLRHTFRNSYRSGSSFL